jgi:hypothetical protein
MIQQRATEEVAVAQTVKVHRKAATVVVAADNL